MSGSINNTASPTDTVAGPPTKGGDTPKISVKGDGRIQWPAVIVSIVVAISPVFSHPSPDLGLRDIRQHSVRSSCNCGGHSGRRDNLCYDSIP